MQTYNKIALGSGPMRTKIKIGQTHLPKRAENEIELKTELIAHKLVRISIRTPRLHETARTTTQQKEREREERETGVKDTREDEIRRGTGTEW